MEFLNGVNKIIDSKYGRFEFWGFFVSLPNRFCRPEDWLHENRGKKAKQQTAQV